MSARLASDNDINENYTQNIVKVPGGVSDDNETGDKISQHELDSKPCITTLKT